jgi:hypothetical protein
MNRQEWQGDMAYLQQLCEFIQQSASTMGRGQGNVADVKRVILGAVIYFS